MTHITITGGAGRWRFAAEGHATGAPEACAGVSALLYALAGWLRSGPPGVRAGEVELTPGRARVAFSGGAQAEAAAALVEVGLRQIARKYPQAVRVAEGHAAPGTGNAAHV